MTQIGLDIGENLIKAVELRIEKNKSELVSISKAPLQDLNFLTDSPATLKNSVSYLTDFVVQNNYLGKSVVVGIPQSSIYTKISTFPGDLKGKELENAVNLQLEEESPIPLTEATKQFQILPKSNPNSDKIEVLEVISPKNLPEKILSLVKSAGLKISAIEPTGLANVRSVIEESIDNPITLIVDIGEKHTDIVIYGDGALRFTRSVSTGFSSIVKAVAQELDLEMIQAEEYVKTYGLVSDKLDGKIRDAISPIYSIILNEMKRSITFYESRNSTNLVKKTVLCGGGSLIPGIVVHSVNFLNTEVQLANPWNRLSSLGKYKDRQSELEDYGPLFTTATGLALKSNVI